MKDVVLVNKQKFSYNELPPACFFQGAANHFMAVKILVSERDRFPWLDDALSRLDSSFV